MRGWGCPCYNEPMGIEKMFGSGARLFLELGDELIEIHLWVDVLGLPHCRITQLDPDDRIPYEVLEEGVDQAQRGKELRQGEDDP